MPRLCLPFPCSSLSWFPLEKLHVLIGYREFKTLSSKHTTMFGMNAIKRCESQLFFRRVICKLLLADFPQFASGVFLHSINPNAHLYVRTFPTTFR